MRVLIAVAVMASNFSGSKWMTGVAMALFAWSISDRLIEISRKLNKLKNL